MDQDLKIDSPDPELVKQVLSSPPFQTIEGVINFREYGFLSAQTKIDSPPISLVRPGILYRSGELTRLTETGKAQLRNLGVTTVFDFRSETEILKYKSATPEIKGMKFVHVPVSDTGEYDPMALAARCVGILHFLHYDIPANPKIAKRAEVFSFFSFCCTISLFSNNLNNGTGKTRLEKVAWEKASDVYLFGTKTNASFSIF